MHSRLSGLLSVALLFVLFPIGCSRTSETSFALRETIADLPELHQENIRTGMRRMFGTPTRPRLLMSLPAEPAESDGDAAASAEATVVAELAAAEAVDIGILEPNRLIHGAQVYRNRCSGCHGITGDGNGEAAAYLQPKPRDYRKGIFKFTSTPYGDRPARQDLVRTIRRGAKGTSMPAFPWMSQEDLDAVVDYVIFLTLRGRVEDGLAYVADDYDPDEPIEAGDFADILEEEIDLWESAQVAVVNPISAEPAYDLASIELGRSLFIESSCYSCHGVDAKGQTEWLSPEFLAAQESAAAGDRVQINYDAWGDPAPAANITARMLHGGRRPLDIYRRIFTGINGTPMPQFGQIFAENPAAIWHMVHYIMHIVDGGDPAVGGAVLDNAAEPEVDAEPAAANGESEAAAEAAEEEIETAA